MGTSTHRPHPSWPHRLISELEAADRWAERLTLGLTHEQLNWRSRPDTWSVGQCIQHLHVTNEVYLPSIAASLEGSQRNPVPEITPGWFGRWFIRKFIAPSAETGRGRAPKKIEPVAEVELSSVPSFLRSNKAVRELVRRASEYDVNRIRFENPFIPVIRFTVGTGFEIISKHQSRHLLQAERVKQSSEFPR